MRLFLTLSVLEETMKKLTLRDLRGILQMSSFCPTLKARIWRSRLWCRSNFSLLKNLFDNVKIMRLWDIYKKILVAFQFLSLLVWWCGGGTLDVAWRRGRFQVAPSTIFNADLGEILSSVGSEYGGADWFNIFESLKEFWCQLVFYMNLWI